MKDKKILLFLILIFVVLLGGASALYNRLGQQLTPDRLAVHESQGTDTETDDTQIGRASCRERV